MHLPVAHIVACGSSGVIGVLNINCSQLRSYSAFSLIMGSVGKPMGGEILPSYYFGSQLGETPATKV